MTKYFCELYFKLDISLCWPKTSVALCEAVLFFLLEKLFFCTQLAFAVHLLGDFYTINTHIVAYFLLLLQRYFVPFRSISFEAFLWFFDNIWLMSLYKFFYNKKLYKNYLKSFEITFKIIFFDTFPGDFLDFFSKCFK